MAVTAADCAGLQFFRSPQGIGFALQALAPVARRSADNPPP